RGRRARVLARSAALFAWRGVWSGPDRAQHPARVLQRQLRRARCEGSARAGVGAGVSDRAVSDAGSGDRGAAGDGELSPGLRWWDALGPDGGGAAGDDAAGTQSAGGEVRAGGGDSLT